MSCDLLQSSKAVDVGDLIPSPERLWLESAAVRPELCFKPAGEEKQN